MIRIEAGFQVKAAHEVDKAVHGSKAVRIVGEVKTLGDTAKMREFVEPLPNWAIIARSSDGSVPIKLGQRLRVLIEDDEAVADRARQVTDGLQAIDRKSVV